MKALVLAAGRGRRLWPFTADCPKCLLSIGQVSILEQQLANLERAGIRQVVVVCGFGSERIHQVVASYPGRLGIKLLYNPFSAIADNLISLWVARSEMDQDFLLLNGDNVFHPDILPLLQSSTAPCCLLIHRKLAYDEDDMKLQLQGERVLRIGKTLPAAVTDAESIGVMKFAGPGVALLWQALEEIVQDERAMSSCFLDSVQYLVDQGHPVVGRDIGELACADVDTPEDLRFVRQHPRLFQRDDERLEVAQRGKIGQA